MQTQIQIILPKIFLRTLNQLMWKWHLRAILQLIFALHRRNVYNSEKSQFELWHRDCERDCELPTQWRTEDLKKKISLFKFGFLQLTTPTHISPPTIFHTLPPPSSSPSSLAIAMSVSVPIATPHRHPFSLPHFLSHSISLLAQFGKAYSFRRRGVWVQMDWNKGRSRMCHLWLQLTDAEHHLPDAVLWKYTSSSAENKKRPLFRSFLLLTIGL